MSRKRGPFPPIFINNTAIDYVNSIHYLGFLISRNGNIRATIEDRISKASRVAHMVLQALRTNRNVSSKLSMTLFDKQIAPILCYGSSVWAVPLTQNLLYLEKQPENQNTRDLVKNILQSILGRNVHFEYARRVGTRSANDQPRKILIKLKDYSDKLELLRLMSDSPYSISNFEEKESIIEKVHHDFCKKSLNISKYASNLAVQSELGRYPVINSAKSFTVKYWLRLKTGCANIVLKEAFTECENKSYEW